MMESLTALDTRVLEALYAARDPNLVQAFMWATTLGSAWIIYAVAACIALMLVHRRMYAYAVGLLVSVASAGIMILILKGLIERARPPVELQAYLESWHSFPSAHAALSVGLYGFLALLAWRLVRHQTARYIALFTFVGVALLISFSRMYLGVHYASDMLAGVALGTACVWLGWKYATIVRNGNS